MKLVFSLLISIVIFKNTFSQDISNWQTRFQKDYDTSKFIPHIVANEWSYSYIQATPTLWYTVDSSDLFQKFADSFLIKVEGQMKDGKRQGVFIYSLIEKSNPKKLLKLYEQTFKDEELSGIWKSYSLDGKLVLSNNFVNGKQIGLQQTYRADGKTLLTETEIISEARSITREFYRSGKLMTETPNLRGKPHGIGRKYYENGNLEDYVEFKFGEMDGNRRYYHANGQLWVEEQYVLDRPWNMITNYDKNGKQRDGGTLKDGTGTMIFYNEDNTIRQIIKYKNGIEVN